MKLNVFYSWQSDSDEGTNRHFIQSCLQDALRDLTVPAVLDVATRGEPGSPDIVASIERKITAAAVVVADITLVGEYHRERFTVNPNVLAEYWFARGVLGPESIVSVANTSYGELGKLPFDIEKNAVRATYSVPESSKPTSKQRKALTKKLRFQIQSVIDQTLFRGLNMTATRLVEWFSESEVGALGIPCGDPDEVSQELGLAADQICQAMYDLEDEGLLRIFDVSGKEVGFAKPVDRLFWVYDRIFRHTHPPTDAVTIARSLLDGARQSGNQFVHVKLKELLEWPWRRLNPAMTYLVENGHAKGSDTIAHPAAYYSITQTPATARFLKASENAA